MKTLNGEIWNNVQVRVEKLERAGLSDILTFIFILVFYSAHPNSTGWTRGIEVFFNDRSSPLTSGRMSFTFVQLPRAEGTIRVHGQEMRSLV